MKDTRMNGRRVCLGAIAGLLAAGTAMGVGQFGSRSCRTWRYAAARRAIAALDLCRTDAVEKRIDACWPLPRLNQFRRRFLSSAPRPITKPSLIRGRS
jgi:hypothetical protein